MVSIINLTLGGIMALLGLAVIVSNLYPRLRCKVAATATVKSLVQEAVTVRRTKQFVFHPKYVYKVKGREYEGVAPFRVRDPKKYRKGDKLLIAYNPNDPAEICFRGKDSTIRTGLLLFAGGAIFLITFYFFGR